MTTLGFYILSLIRFRDHFIVDYNIMSNIFRLKINPEIFNNAYKDEANNNYIEYLIKRASTFSDTFRSFFLIHLNCCCPYLHTKEFIQVACSTSNVNLRHLYDQLIEQSRTLLTLKQRCRLLIKESLNRFPSDLQSLTQLPISLRYFASFDLLNPNFPQITLNTLTKVGGRIVPNLFDKILFMEHLSERTSTFTDSENETSEYSDDFYHYDSYYDDDDDDNFMHFWDDDDEDEDELVGYCTTTHGNDLLFFFYSRRKTKRMMKSMWEPMKKMNGHQLISQIFHRRKRSLLLEIFL